MTPCFGLGVDCPMLSKNAWLFPNGQAKAAARWAGRQHWSLQNARCFRSLTALEDSLLGRRAALLDVQAACAMLEEELNKIIYIVFFQFVHFKHLLLTPATF